jgi:hypothetical protein
VLLPSAEENRVKPFYDTLHVVYARISYDVEVRIFPPRAFSKTGPDSPKYLDPGHPLRVQILRILKDRVEQRGGDLMSHARQAITELVELEAAAKYCNSKKAKESAPVCAGQVAVIPLEADESGQLRLLEDSQ